LLRQQHVWYNPFIVIAWAAIRGPLSANLSEEAMKRLFTLVALATLLISFGATAQVPRAPLVEMGSATW